MCCCYFITEYSQFFLLILYDFAVLCFIYPYALATQYIITIIETVILQYQLRVRKYRYYIKLDFPGGSAGKESACNAGDLASIPGLRRSPGEGKATHSSLLLAWRTPWTVQSVGSQRVEHDLATAKTDTVKLKIIIIKA